MDKLLTFQTQTDKGIFLYTVGEGRDQVFLEKTASAEFHPEIAQYIKTAHKIPGKTQLLLTALGAGEFYGSNVNGDFFPEGPLKNPTPEFGYKTFERMAHVYKHHVNKDPKKSYGTVALSVWNNTMKRVELIVITDDAKAPDIVERVNRGEYPEVSMGCRVPYDVCSICGNKAKTRAQYCDHLRYHMNKIPPGHTKKAYALNTMPKFFDISFVLVGADRIASVMKKVAHMHPQYGVSSAEAAESVNLPIAKTASMEKLAFGLNRQKVASKKLAEMKKEIPSNLDGNTSGVLDQLGLEGAEALRPLEKDIPRTVIIRITRGSPGMDNVNRSLSTLAMMGILPKKREFQDIVLRGMGHISLADRMYERGETFDPSMPIPESQRSACLNSLDLSPSNFDSDIFRHMRPFLADRSYARPLLRKRVIRLVKLAEAGKLEYPVEETEKYASDSDERSPLSITTVMAGLAGLYYALSSKAARASETGVGKVLADHPALGMALGVGTVVGAKELFGNSTKGKYDFNPEKGPIGDINMSWQDQIKIKNKNPLTKMGSIKGVGKALFLGVPALYLASGAQEVRHARNPGQEGFIGRTIRKYPDVLSAGLVGHAMMGSPVTNKLKASLGFMRKAAEDRSKSQVGKDFLSTAVFSLAFPGKSLVSRAIGNTVDQGIISGVGKLLSHKQNTNSNKVKKLNQVGRSI